MVGGKVNISGFVLSLQEQFMEQAEICDLLLSTFQSRAGAKVVEVMRQQRQEDYSVLGLLLNIEKMEEYLKNKGLNDHLSTFR